MIAFGAIGPHGEVDAAPALRTAMEELLELLAYAAPTYYGMAVAVTR